MSPHDTRFYAGARALEAGGPRRLPRDLGHRHSLRLQAGRERLEAQVDDVKWGTKQVRFGHTASGCLGETARGAS